VRFINKVPALNYYVWSEKEMIMLDAISDASFLGLNNNSSGICSELFNYVYSLEEKKTLSEFDIKNEIKPELNKKIMDCKILIESKIKSIEADSIDSSKEQELIKLKDYKTKFNSLVALTDTLFNKEILLDIQVGSGEIVRIFIKRDDNKKWTFELKGRQSGKWVTTYGFSFTSQRLESPTYFSKQIPDEPTFQILKSRRANIWDLNYVPAVFFSYFPSQNFKCPWNHSLTAGLGFDLSAAPTVFLGYNGMFYHNIGLSTGVSFYQQNRLKSQFTENETVTTSFDKEGLHDKIYRPNLFISVNFRFGENPFKPNNESGNE